MIQLHEGQCGLCTHYGEHHQRDSLLVQIRTTRRAPETLLDDCGHPKHAELHLQVTPVAGCDGFTMAPASA
jgi:hypothetical protein